MKLMPINDRVVIEPKQSPSKTDGGLFLPEIAQEKPQIGTVVWAGAGEKKDGKVFPLSVVEGDDVLFAKYSGTEIKMDGRKLIVMRESDILAVIEK